jgi:phosphatidylglycerophosphate synthase
MQALVSLPKIEPKSLEQVVFQQVAGVPLLVRVIATAARSGATSFLVLHPRKLSAAALHKGLQSPILARSSIELVALDEPFEPDRPADWNRIQDRLSSQFLWLPWNFVTPKRPLAALLTGTKGSSVNKEDASATAVASASSRAGADAIPAVIEKDELLMVCRGSLAECTQNSSPPSLTLQAAGIRVDSPETRRQAETLLIKGAGKDTDGFHSNFNRRLSRPGVRLLLKTPITANMVSLAGLPVAALAGLAYAGANWSAYLAGSLLYYLSVLFDEADGMIARTKFQESPFGNQLEAFVDFVSYLFLWTGMTIGLYRQLGDRWLLLGELAFFGTSMSFLLQAYQRKLATHPDRPHEHVKILYQRFEADSGNLISWISRKAHFLTKKGAMCHYVIWFSVLGLLPVFFVLTVIGCNLLWICGIYANRLFRPSKKNPFPMQDSTMSMPVH